MVLALLACAAPATTAEKPPTARDPASKKGIEISYEDFAALSTQARLEAFDRMSPDGKAKLCRTHLQRWRDANESRLNTAQLAFIDVKAMPLITADVYKRPRAEDRVHALRQAEEEAHYLFDRADVSAAFHLIGIVGGPDTPAAPAAEEPRSPR